LLNISVNVSAQQLADASFPRVVASALNESGLDPDRLWLEITESTLMSTGDASAAALSALRGLGAHLEIDDFGTGYSSLSYLKRLPVETLKVDQSFVDELDCDADDVAIVRAIVGLGDSLGLAIVAEGVERRAQANALMALGCSIAQGYLFGYPQPASTLEPYPADDLSNWSMAAQIRTSA
jgi:EAL domain-containing protein (putative c-di-GMP-specific phosphodiesterase class I)